MGVAGALFGDGWLGNDRRRGLLLLPIQPFVQSYHVISQPNKIGYRKETIPIREDVQDLMASYPEDICVKNYRSIQVKNQQPKNDLI